ncbi:MAG: MerR family transcriptional regulator [Candidatus Binatia bacterium]
MKPLSIGQVAKQAGVGVETIRFYERQGLIEQPTRRPSGYRQYSAAAIDRLVFIQRAKQLGFSLREIGELLSLRVDGAAASCRAVKSPAQAKLADIEEKIRALRRMRSVLRQLVAACDEHRPMSECPILGALSGAGGAKGRTPELRAERAALPRRRSRRAA